MFYVLLGGREAGKSYAVMEFFVGQWKKYHKPFTWLRLTEPSVKKLLSNKADKFVDADIKRRYDLDLTVKGNQVFDHGEPMAKVLALSTFYNDKGVALFDNEFDLGYNICLDEMNREQTEKNTFDIAYAFVNQMENLVRSTKDKVRIVLIGNTLQEASDIMCCFNFVPEQFGRYYIRKKRCVVDYVEPSERYKKRRKGTVADILTPTASTFTNEIEVDKSLVTKRRLIRPSYVIKFTTDKSTWFTVWDNRVIKRYNKENVSAVPMRKFLDEIFNDDLVAQVKIMFDSRYFLFRDLITQKMFKKELTILKNSKY